MTKGTISKADAVAAPFIEDDRTSLSVAGLTRAVADHLRYSVCRLPAVADSHDYYRALALAVRDRMQHRWMASTQTCLDLNRKVACYLSAEFLMGPHLGNNLVNLLNGTVWVDGPQPAGACGVPAGTAQPTVTATSTPSPTEPPTVTATATAPASTPSAVPTSAATHTASPTEVLATVTRTASPTAPPPTATSAPMATPTSSGGTFGQGGRSGGCATTDSHTAGAAWPLLVAAFALSRRRRR